MIAHKLLIILTTIKKKYYKIRNIGEKIWEHGVLV